MLGTYKFHILGKFLVITPLIPIQVIVLHPKILGPPALLHIIYIIYIYYIQPHTYIYMPQKSIQIKDANQFINSNQ